MSLTDKQRRFVEEYLVDLNASAAARRAGYSEKTAGTIGFENLQKPKIQDALQEEMDARSERTKITQDMVVQGLLEEANRADDDGGNSSARIKAWKELGRHLGMFTDKVDLDADVDLGQLDVTVVDRRSDE